MSPYRASRLPKTSSTRCASRKSANASIWDLVPAARRREEPAPAWLRSIPEQPERVAAARRWSEHFELSAPARQARELQALQDAHHETRAALDAVRVALHDSGSTRALEGRVAELERLASITTTSAWLRQVDVPESMMISVVMPTHNRGLRLLDAIESVQAQRYRSWELVVVDDGSDDDTWSRLTRAAAKDERIRPFRIAQSGPAVARNYALDHAAGDAIVYLDDDNRFEPDWLRAVVWAFAGHEERRVLYGARLVDDFGRYHSGVANGTPWVQFLPWDRGAARGVQSGRRERAGAPADSGAVRPGGRVLRRLGSGAAVDRATRTPTSWP